MICHKEPGTKIFLGDFSMPQKNAMNSNPTFSKPVLWHWS